MSGEAKPTRAPHRATARLRTIVEQLGYLGIWIGLYVGAAVIMLGDRTATQVALPAAAGATLLTMSVYQLDRIKWSNRLLDPADAEAHPERSAFLAHHATRVRLTALLLAMASAGLLAWAWLPLALLAPCSHAGMLLYAGGEHSKRIKDRLGLKNLAVAGAITALAVVVILGPIWAEGSAPTGGAEAIAASASGSSRMPGVPSLAAGAGFLLLIVLADAILCDIDDAASDARYGTRTLPNTIGIRGTWAVALALHILAAGVVIGERLVVGSAIHPQTWGYLGALIGSAGLLALLRPSNLRDAVDMRLPLVALLMLA